ncbi:DUF169 domain-containing protein [Gaoshiqia sediminis]|uniref:DUF169 domain-containing protein n=1 Tax=Gaoshiqia sediminis TaxID=2986998 RepID=A0AA41YDM5_9BACT|nr:DUF169 domain-containing protein [Gaoshiqia sediminis]MCW0484913.1 DUF169 domain-containing protein [Gaoshiqia sediminis]
MIEDLKAIFGPKCTAIAINKDLPEMVNIPSNSMKLCEAVNYSFCTPLKIVHENLGCPGARRSTGFDNDDSALARTISANSQIPLRFTTDALQEIPKLEGVNFVVLGISENMETVIQPDLYIIYVQPYMVTNLMHVLAKNEIKPAISPFSLLSICGNVFANCYKNKVVTLSFGCPESRKHGGVEKSEVVVGIPFKYARFLVDSQLKNFIKSNR